MSRKIPHPRKCLLDCAHKKGMRTYDLNSDSHSRHALGMCHMLAAGWAEPVDDA